MRRDLQPTERECGVRIPGQGEFPGASARDCLPAQHLIFLER